MIFNCTLMKSCMSRFQVGFFYLSYRVMYLVEYLKALAEVKAQLLKQRPFGDIHMKIKLLGLATLLASGSSFAAEGDPSAITAAINGAITVGQSNYGLVVVGLIGLAAIGFGLRSIVSAMR